MNSPYFRTMLKSKIHRAKVTDCNLAYEGSITIDQALMDEADLLPFEEVAVYNIQNGERFRTYVIPGPRGNGDICINGAAAHKANPNDLVIIASYCGMEEELARNYKPKLVMVDTQNQVQEISSKTKPGLFPVHA